jgi:hypothetical protein
MTSQVDALESPRAASTGPEFVLTCAYGGVTLIKRFPQSLNAELMAENHAIAAAFVDQMHEDLGTFGEYPCA